jgi:hypothetical protein
LIPAINLAGPVRPFSVFAAANAIGLSAIQMTLISISAAGQSPTIADPTAKAIAEWHMRPRPDEKGGQPMLDAVVGFDALHAENASLRERVAQLEHMLCREIVPIPANWFLSPLQYAIVDILRKGRLIHQRSLIRAMVTLYPDVSYCERHIYSAIQRLNRKLSAHGYHIRCVTAAGYRFEPLAPVNNGKSRKFTQICAGKSLQSCAHG